MQLISNLTSYFSSSDPSATPGDDSKGVATALARYGVQDEPWAHGLARPLLQDAGQGGRSLDGFTVRILPAPAHRQLASKLGRALAQPGLGADGVAAVIRSFGGATPSAGVLAQAIGLALEHLGARAEAACADLGLGLGKALGGRAMDLVQLKAIDHALHRTCKEVGTGLLGSLTGSALSLLADGPASPAWSPALEDLVFGSTQRDRSPQDQHNLALHYLRLKAVAGHTSFVGVIKWLLDERFFASFAERGDMATQADRLFSLLPLDNHRLRACVLEQLGEHLGVMSAYAVWGFVSGLVLRMRALAQQAKGADAQKARDDLLHISKDILGLVNDSTRAVSVNGLCVGIVGGWLGNRTEPGRKPLECHRTLPDAVKRSMALELVKRPRHQALPGLLGIIEVVGIFTSIELPAVDDLLAASDPHYPLLREALEMAKDMQAVRDLRNAEFEETWTGTFPDGSVMLGKRESKSGD